MRPFLKAQPQSIATDPGSAAFANIDLIRKHLLSPFSGLKIFSLQPGGFNPRWRDQKVSTIAICFAVSFFLVVGILGVTLAQQSSDQFDLERIQRATVFILQAHDVGDNLEVTCVGTGTIVSRSGLILTNAHNTLQSRACSGDTLVVALSTRLDEPPVPRYRAAIAQFDSGLDLALLSITREIDGRLIQPNTLALPFVELADSSSVQLDQTIAVVGYPGIGNDPVSIVRGTISGFVAEPSGGNQSWIKTSAAIAGTMSGGGAYDQDGRLIGIPTTAPVTSESGNFTCVWDTNRDGLVNNDDTCVPLGDAINSLRPSNFARPLLRAASLGLTLQNLAGFASPAPAGNAPGFRRLFFSPSVNEAGMPTSVLRSLPAGSNSLYLFFDYASMSPETVYSLRVTTDGIPNPTFSLAPVRWSGGTRGLWYLGSNSQPWPNGVYEFTLFANGVAADTARLVIGGAPEQIPTFSDITFGLLDLQGNILGNGFVLPTGSVANAQFLYRNMVDGTAWTAVWYYEGTELTRTQDVWGRGATGTMTASISDPNGLLPGNYRVELYIEDRLAATSDFIIAGAQESVFPRIFDGAHFTSAASPAEALRASAINNFSAATDSIYSLFDWQQIAPGTSWTMRWSVDGEMFYEQTVPWVGEESGDNYLLQLTAPGGIPDGTYKMELFIGKVQLASITARVGIGQLPIDRFANATGAQLRGRILDADTGEGISGVTFVLISDQFSVDEFQWLADQIYSLAVTDLDGRFEIDRPLEFSTEDRPVPYSAIVTAEGYLPVSADGIEIKLGEENPVNMTIYMTRD
jgi:hypothetical protein